MTTLATELQERIRRAKENGEENTLPFNEVRENNHRREINIAREGDRVSHWESSCLGTAACDFLPSSFITGELSTFVEARRCGETVPR